MVDPSYHDKCTFQVHRNGLGSKKMPFSTIPIKRKSSILNPKKLAQVLCYVSYRYLTKNTGENLFKASCG